MSPDKFTTLKSWLESPLANNSTVPYISNLLEVIDTPKIGRCMVTTSEIKKNEKVIEIPKVFLLNYTTVLKHLAYWNDEIDEFLNEKIQNFKRYSIIYENNDTKLTPEIVEIYKKLNCQKLLSLSAHQLLTMYISLERKRQNSSFWYPLFSCFPELHEYDSIPMKWNLKNSSLFELKLFNLLPKSVLSHATSQCHQFYEDIDQIRFILEGSTVEISDDEYLWSWLAINTRCLYYKLPSYLPITQTKDNAASNITLVPFVDFINHKSDKSNSIAEESKRGYQVKVIKDVSASDHLWFTYGPHNDEFLQCEYGFSTSQLSKQNYALKYSSFNIYNTFDLSPIFLKLLSNPKKEYVVQWLKQTGYYDDYTLGVENIKFDDNGDDNFQMVVKPSYRTRIVIASLVEKDVNFKYNESQNSINCPLKLEKFYQGYNDGEYYQDAESTLLKKMIGKRKEEIYSNLEKIGYLGTDGENDMIKTDVIRKLLEGQLFILESF